jgi:hypothetical protein
METKLNDDLEISNCLDVLDKPGNLKKAREHGSAQRLLKIPENFLAYSIFSFI